MMISNPEEQYQKATKCAAAMLARRALSEAMLEQKLLEKGFSVHAAEYAAARMRVLGAVDDTAYAEQIMRCYARKGYGELRIRQEMRRRGIAQDSITEVLPKFEPNWVTKQLQ